MRAGSKASNEFGGPRRPRRKIYWKPGHDARKCRRNYRTELSETVFFEWLKKMNRERKKNEGSAR